MTRESLQRPTLCSLVVGALAVLALFLAMLATASAAVAIPNTPAGKVLAAWLTAFNSGDRNRLESYYRAYQPDSLENVDFDLMVFKGVGGFDLLSIRRSAPRQIEYLVIGRRSHLHVVGELDVGDSDPRQVIDNPIDSFLPGAQIIGFQIDPSDRARVTRAIAAKLDQLYVYPDMGKTMALDITSRWKRGQYDSISNGHTFARQLTADLQAISHDRHLRVNFSAVRLAVDGSQQGTAPAAPQQRTELEQGNCAFKRVEWLPGNVGYLRFDGFGDATVCASTAAAAMGFLANVDAIVFDMRENHGGDPALVRFVESYLFASRTHLDDFRDRRSGQTKQTWTLLDVPGKRMPSIPVYILSSHRTFSGGEAFAYELQALKRATVVGEVTGGGGHLVQPERIDDRFMLSIPFARPINPVTKTDWEGSGVVPDVKVPAAQALDVAEKLAAAELAKRRSAGDTGKD